MPALIPFNNQLSPKRNVPIGDLVLDEKHPLALQMIGCWLPGVTGGFNIGSSKVTLTPLTAAVFAAGPEGPGLKSTVASSGMTAVAPSAFISWTTEFSLHWRGIILAAPDNGTPFIVITYNDVAGSPFYIAAIQHNVGGFTIDWNTAGTFTELSGGVFSTPNRFSLTATFLVGGNVKFYINGIKNVTEKAFGASGPNSTATSTIGINCFPGLATRKAQANCAMACAWTRVLSASEAMLLHQEPYGFLTHPEPELDAVFIDDLRMQAIF